LDSFHNLEGNQCGLQMHLIVQYLQAHEFLSLIISKKNLLKNYDYYYPGNVCDSFDSFFKAKFHKQRSLSFLSNLNWYVFIFMRLFQDIKFLKNEYQVSLIRERKNGINRCKCRVEHSIQRLMRLSQVVICLFSPT